MRRSKRLWDKLLEQLEWHEQRAVNWLADSMLERQLECDSWGGTYGPVFLWR